MTPILLTLTVIIVIYFACLGIWYTILLIASFPDVIKKFKEFSFGNMAQLINQNSLIPITVVVPAFNEEKRILNMLYSGLNSEYKNVRFIVVNDGSTDDTMNLLIKEFDMFEAPVIIKQTIKTSLIKKCYQSQRVPNLILLDKEHSPHDCAADAVNAGLNACQTPIMLTIDADTILEPKALTTMLVNFFAHDHCIAVGGSVYVLNNNKIDRGQLLTNKLPYDFMPAIQSLEYLRSFLYGRSGLNQFGGSLTYPGAFTLFETDILRKVNGFDTANFAYDTEIIVKLHHHMHENDYPYNVNHAADAFCWTEVPSTFASYWKQRNKWHRGMLRSSLKHASMFLNPKYGFTGMLVFPAFVFFDILGPIIELFSMVLFVVAYFVGQINFPALFWFMILAWGYIAYITVAMIFLNLISFKKYNQISSSFRAMWLSLAEMCGVRQYRALCCTLASAQYLINRLRGKPL